MDSKEKRRIYHNPVQRGFFPDPSVIRVDNHDIDSSLFVDDDGKRYMVIARAARLVPLRDDGMSVEGDAVTAWMVRIGRR